MRTPVEEPEDPGGGRTALEDAVTVVDEQTVPVTAPLRAIATRTLALLGVPPQASLTITLVEPDAIASLKEQAFGIHAATDVLAFPVDDPFDPAPGPVVLGDLVLCPAVATRQARALGSTLDAEMVELVVHGLLHLAGRTHDTPRQELAMAGEQRRLVSLLSEGAA